MKEITVDESRQIQLRILKNIDAFCRTNDLHYSMAGGSMIGAVRHKGFIPWDDDIDLIMLRPDYERFMKDYKDDYYRLMGCDRDKNWPWTYSSVVDPNTEIAYVNGSKSIRGIWVTICPVDNVPTKKKEFDRIIKRIHYCEDVMIRLKDSFWTSNTNFFYNILKLLARLLLLPFPKSYFAKKEEILFKKTKFTGMIGSPCVWSFQKPFTYPKELFNGFVDLEFENMTCMAIAGFDQYLRAEFGDYMQLPPEEERIPKHEFKAYWK